MYLCWHKFRIILPSRKYADRHHYENLNCWFFREQILFNQLRYTRRGRAFKNRLSKNVWGSNPWVELLVWP